MGGSGNKSPMGKTKYSAVEVQFDNGVKLSYRVQKSGVITDMAGTKKINTNGLSIDDIVSRAIGQGAKVTTYDKKQLSQWDIAKKKYKEEVNKFLNFNDAKDRSNTYKAPRKGWKGH